MRADPGYTLDSSSATSWRVSQTIRDFRRYDFNVFVSVFPQYPSQSRSQCLIVSQRGTVHESPEGKFYPVGMFHAYKWFDRRNTAEERHRLHRWVGKIESPFLLILERRMLDEVLEYPFHARTHFAVQRSQHVWSEIVAVIHL